MTVSARRRIATLYEVSAKPRLRPPDQKTIMVVVDHINQHVVPLKVKDDMAAIMNPQDKAHQLALDLLQESNIDPERVTDILPSKPGLVPICIIPINGNFRFPDYTCPAPTGVIGGSIIDQYEGGTKVRIRRYGTSTLTEEHWSDKTMVYRSTEPVVPPHRDQSGSDGSGPKVGTPRMSLFGQSITAIIRWMGVNGWTFADTRKALVEGMLIPVSDSTIRCQLRGAIDGSRGDPGKVTKEEAEKLKKCLE